jgi:hypothetical protein
MWLLKNSMYLGQFSEAGVLCGQAAVSLDSGVKEVTSRSWCQSACFLHGNTALIRKSCFFRSNQEGEDAPSSGKTRPPSQGAGLGTGHGARCVSSSATLHICSPGSCSSPLCRAAGTHVACFESQGTAAKQGDLMVTIVITGDNHA